MSLIFCHEPYILYFYHMPYKSRIQIRESLEILNEKFRQEQAPRIKLKIKSLIIYKQYPEKRQQDIAGHLCIGYSTIKRWFKEYREHGFDSFITVKLGSPKKSVVPEQVHIALQEKVNNANDPLLGYWDAVRWVEAEFGIKIYYQTLRKYMMKHFKTKLKAPRKSHYQKDEQAIEAFLKTT